jgi:sulfate permease, SulP family
VSRPHIATLGRVPGARGQFGDQARHPENEAPPGIAVPRVESGLFFGNADTVRDRIRAAARDAHAVVLARQRSAARHGPAS